MNRTKGRNAALRLVISSTTLATIACSPLLHAQEMMAAATTDMAALATETIVVLGTRRTDRSITDSASPVDVIGATELATQPAADMLEVLKNVVPSFNVAQNQISDASTFVRAPSLRGLAGD
ncbi:MAG TPA: TonB-dependent receptor plug domain-containing protein, partial [Povalibacter sp.]